MKLWKGSSASSKVANLRDFRGQWTQGPRLLKAKSLLFCRDSSLSRPTEYIRGGDWKPHRCVQMGSFLLPMPRNKQPGTLEAAAKKQKPRARRAAGRLPTRAEENWQVHPQPRAGRAAGYLPTRAEDGQVHPQPRAGEGTAGVQSTGIP